MEATTTRRRRTVKPITQSLKRYTKAELNAMLDEAEAEIAAGGGTPHEEVMREWEEEFADIDKELYTPEDAYELTMKDIKAIYEDAAV